jgi:hypothetical protein
MSTPTTIEIERFVQEWMSEHLRVQPGLANLPLEVDRLAAHLTGDARSNGISGGDMHRALGDIDAYLTDRYMQALEMAAPAAAANG